MNKYEEVLKKYSLSLSDGQVREKSEALCAKWEENLTAETLRLLYGCIDLTTLNTEDSRESVWKFVRQVNDFDGTHSDINNVAAICVYPNFVSAVKEALTADVRIASVAGGFPSSQTFSEVKIAEVSLAIADGADEIDIVFNVGAFFDGSYEDICNEIAEIKEVCRNVQLKVILETGLLKTVENIYRAAVLAMYSGADFLKTSTGKGYPGASIEAVYVLCLAIKEYEIQHGTKIGIKVSGGVRTAEEAVKYYTIVKETLGREWLTPEFFRIGASSLANSILTLQAQEK
ncbi:MAG: deoxyribose-phosphate aldolase [Dysgonamonadaceae bacterium]|jgi:deoxyribose-phosphate aldolase|nr:deoxyribose-phosphate aldolase [Dysgonamonadaceae bacterium]